jgi:integrase
VRGGRTIKYSARALGLFARDLAWKTTRDISVLEIVEWRKRRVEAGASHKTVNNDVGVLKAALALAVQLGQIRQHPLAGLKGLPISGKHCTRRARALNEDEIGRLLDAAAKHDRRSGGFPREPLLRVLLATGARWNEVIQARWADFDEAGRQIHFREESSKNLDGRSVPLAEDVARVISALRFEHVRALGLMPRGDDRIFLTPRGKAWPQHTGNFRKWLVDLLISAGISRRDATGRVVHVHALRHTFVTRLARADVSVQQAQALSGHRSAQLVTRIYTHLAASDVRRIVDRLPPLGNARNSANKAQLARLAQNSLYTD